MGKQSIIPKFKRKKVKDESTTNCKDKWKDTKKKNK